MILLLYLWMHIQIPVRKYNIWESPHIFHILNISQNFHFIFVVYHVFSHITQNIILIFPP